MQIHPNNLHWGREREVLEKGFIGLGVWPEKGGKNKQQNQFEHEMKEGHVVLIRKGGAIIALVEILGPYEFSKTTDALLWFERRRRIKILDWYKEAYKFNCIKMGTLKKCLDMNKPTNRAVLSWYTMVQQRRNEMLETLCPFLKKSFNLILTGAPGTGKTYLAKQIAQQLVFGEKWVLKKETDFTKEDQCQFDQFVGFVQFHPSYDYTDFVEGLRPKKNSDGSGNIGFERKDGVFKKFCEDALKHCKYGENGKFDETNSRKFVFIIDEINRGEISKIFGELFFSMDPGYRGTAGKVSTQYANMQDDDKAGTKDCPMFFVPENVYIIGTMNDIDRSVESFDFAMRRRFVWVEIKAWDTKEGKNIVPMLEGLDKIKPGLTEAAVKRLVALNRSIWNDDGDGGKGTGIDGLSPSYHIGGAYFLKLRDYEGSFDDLWKYHLAPLLCEYLRGMPEEKAKLKMLRDAYDAANN